MKKPWYLSLTIVSGLLFTAASVAEQTGALPAGTSADLIKDGLGMGVLIGLRRALG